MRAERNPNQSNHDHWADTRVVLDLLVESHPAQWALHELSRAVSPSAEACTGEEPSSIGIEDALQALYGAGLVHRVGQFAFASRGG
jgi:hypothetical protein